jgi:hypothetical protein
LAVQLAAIQMPQQSSMSPRGRESALPTPNTFDSEEVLGQRQYPTVDEDEPSDAKRYALDLDINPPLREEQKPAPIYVGKEENLHPLIDGL